MKLTILGFTVSILGLIIWNPITLGLSPVLGGAVLGTGLGLMIVACLLPTY